MFFKQRLSNSTGLRVWLGWDFRIRLRGAFWRTPRAAQAILSSENIIGRKQIKVLTLAMKCNGWLGNASELDSVRRVGVHSSPHVIADISEQEQCHVRGLMYDNRRSTNL